MSSKEETGGDSPVDPPSSKADLFKPKAKPKTIRVLTVMAYVLSVSMTAILLSIYYLFMWEGRPHIGARTSGSPLGNPEFLQQNHSDYSSFRLITNNYSNNKVAIEDHHHNKDGVSVKLGNLTLSSFEEVTSESTSTQTNLTYDGDAKANKTIREPKPATNDTGTNDRATTHVDRGEHHLV